MANYGTERSDRSAYILTAVDCEMWAVFTEKSKEYFLSIGIET